MSGTETNTSRQPGNRAEDILLAATELFHEYGYHGVGLRSIAQQVGIQTPSIYHHFPSKEAILFELSRRAAGGFIDSHLPILSGDEPAAVRLYRLAHHHLVYYWEHRLIQEVTRRELRVLDGESREWVIDRLRHYHNGVRDFVIEQTRAGAFRCQEPELASLAIIDMLLGVNAWFRPGEPLSLEELADRYARMVVVDFLNGTLPDDLTSVQLITS